MLRAVARPEEHQMLASLPTADGLAWDRLLFCAKEAVCKAWFPVARRWLWFDEATVAIVPDGTFTARLHTRGPGLLGRPLTGFDGRWAASDTLIMTVITVERITLKSERTIVEGESNT